MAISNLRDRLDNLLSIVDGMKNSEIRNEILIENPEDRVSFTRKQCELVNGFPLKADGQDNLDEVLTLSDMEIKFWQTVGIDPYYMYIDDTLDLVNMDYVESNRKLMLEEMSKNVKVDAEELYEFDVDGDLMALSFD